MAEMTVKDMAMGSVDNNGDARQPGCQPAQNAGLGSVSVDDFRLYAQKLFCDFPQRFIVLVRSDGAGYLRYICSTSIIQLKFLQSFLDGIN